MISYGEPAEEEHSTAPVMVGNSAATRNEDVGATEESTNTPEAPRRAGAASSSGGFVNPLGGTASLLGGKKKLDLPNPMYRPK